METVRPHLPKGKGAVNEVEAHTVPPVSVGSSLPDPQPQDSKKEPVAQTEVEV